MSKNVLPAGITRLLLRLEYYQCDSHVIVLLEKLSKVERIIRQQGEAEDV